MIDHETNIATAVVRNKRRKRKKDVLFLSTWATNLAVISTLCIEFTTKPHPVIAQLVCDARIAPYLYKTYF